MKLGVVFPTTDIGADAVAVRDFVVAVEELGYDRILFYDHVLGADPSARRAELEGFYTHSSHFHEVMVLMGYCAAITQRIELATGVLVATQRQTALIAKQAAEVAILSNYRLSLGLGIGWNPHEYEGMGVPFTQRGARLDEQVEVLRLLWSGNAVSFAGQFHTLDRVGISPLPDKPIPLWFGGSSDAALDRAAKVGDGFTFMGADVERVLQRSRALTDRLNREGRSKEPFGREMLVTFAQGAPHWHTSGAAFSDAGGTHLTMRSMEDNADWSGQPRVGVRTIEQHIRAAQTFIRFWTDRNSLGTS